MGIAIDLDAIPVAPLGRDLCAVFGLDPLGVIASGALLATAAPENVQRLLALWAEVRWPGAVIGRILPGAGDYRATRGGESVPFPTFAVDEITRLWA